MRSTHKTFALWAVLIVVGIIVFQMYEQRRQKVIAKFEWPEFVQALNAGQIESVVVQKETGEISGKIADEFRDQNKGDTFAFTGPGTTDVLAAINKANEASGKHLQPRFQNSE